MGRKCCVLNCKLGYKTQPKEDGDRDVTNHSFIICSKHFQDSDLVYDKLDTNNRRKRKLQKENLKVQICEIALNIFRKGSLLRDHSWVLH